MTVLKQYNTGTSAWETVVVGGPGPAGGGTGTGVTTGTKGDINVVGADTDWQIVASAVGNAELAANAVDNSKVSATAGVALSKLATQAPNTFVANATGGTVAPTAVTSTAATALLDRFSTTATTQGLVIGSNGAATTNFLRADGTWAIPPGGGGGIAGVIIQSNDTTVATAATTIDFGPGLTVSETPTFEANIGLDLTTYAGAALPLLRGGTGASTKATAFDALSPMTTAGDVVIGGTAGTGTRLPVGSAGQVLTVTAGAPAWAAPSGGSGAPYTAPTTTVAGIIGVLEGTTNGTNRVNLTGPANIAADYTVTLPATADTLVGRASTDTLTNKSISLASNTVTTTLAQLNTAITDADVVAGLGVSATICTGVWIGNQAQYDALGTWSSTVLYAIS